MPDKNVEDVLVELRRLVDSLGDENRVLSQEETDKLTVATKNVLEDGFKGSRAVKGHLWNLVNASGRAFPVLLHPSIGKAKAIARQEGLENDAKVLLWIQEALHQGVLSTFTQKVPTQYHIMSAYSPEAAMNDTSLRSEFEGLLSQLKGLPPSLPDTVPCSSCGSADASFSEILSPTSEHYIESSPATSPKQNILEANIFRRLSQKSHGIQIPWLESIGSRVDENLVHLSLHVIEDPEAGQVVKLSITLSQSAGLSQHGSFVSEMAQGFNNVLDTLVRRSSTADGKKSLKSQDSLEGAMNEKELKQVETSQDKQPNFQNMWGNFVKPFTKSGKGTPKAEASKGADSSDSAAIPGKNEAHPPIPQKDANEANTDSLTNSSAASTSAQKKDPPAWLKQSGLGFLAPVFGQKAARGTDMTSEKDQAAELKSNKRRGTADSIEKPKPEVFFQNLFRKSMQKSIEDEEEEELQDLGGQELGSIGKKDPAPQASIQELEAELLLGDPLAASLTSGDAMRMSIQMLSPRSSTGLVKAAYVQEKMEMASLKENEALISNIQSACETMENEALLSGGVIRNDTKGTGDLCFSIEMLLSSCMRQKPRPWRSKGGGGLKFFTDIADLIPKGQKSPFMVLRNAQRMIDTSLDLPAGLGVDVIEGMMAGGGDSLQLHAWLRSSLNSQCLGRRIKALSDMDQLWEGWYEEGSLLYSKDGRKKFVSALKSIDDIHCLVAVDRWTETKEEKGINRAPAGQSSAVVPAVKSLQTSEAPSIAPSTARTPTPTSTERQGSKNVSRKQSSRQRKRVIDFDVEPQTTTPSPFETPELSTLPPDYFECAEPLSFSDIAQALGMGSPEPSEHKVDGETGEDMQNEFSIDDILLNSPVDKDEETVETGGPKNTVEHSDQVNRASVAQSTLDVSAESLQTSLTSQIDLFLKEIGTQGHPEVDTTSQAEETTSMITNITESTKSMDGNGEKTLKGGHHESASIPKIDFFRGSDFVADQSLSSMAKDCAETMQSGDESLYEDSSLDELSSCAAEENVQEAIRIAEQEFEHEELLCNWSKRNYLPACPSLEEELEPLEPEDLGVSAEDLARSSHKYADTLLPQEITGAIDRSPNWENMVQSNGDQSDAQVVTLVAKADSEDIQIPQVLDEMKPMDTLDGVWKDIDVLASETMEDSSGSYTVYVMELTASDGTTWQVSRRFRDIVALRKQLKLREGILLPKSWENVKKSRHITGSSRLSVDIIDARNALMRQCLWDLRSTYTECLGWEEVATFLDAPLHILRSVKARTGTSTTDDVMSICTRLPEEAMGQGPGISMRLLVDLQKEESCEALLKAQHGKCAGCHAAFPDTSSSWGLSSYLWTTSRSSGPRKCEYTNRLYCHSCHHNDLEVIPSHVLHNWDFTEKLVSKVSKEYLKSIKTKAVLGLGSVNPGMFARVPLLAHVQSMRQKVIRTLSVVKGAGSEGEAMAAKVIKESGVHGYLLEGTDFWSLHDLIDISKGSAFSNLPRWLETISGKIGRMATSAVLKYEDER